MNKLTCKERDAILLDPVTRMVDKRWLVESSLTDICGEFGEPRITTTWGLEGRRVEDVRHPDPNGGPDVEPCEHYEWEVSE